jgi:hypothetical protein
MVSFPVVRFGTSDVESLDSKPTEVKKLCLPVRNLYRFCF